MAKKLRCDGFPARLREAREKTELSMAALGEKAGLSRATVSLYEAGERDPSLRALEQLAVVLGVDPGWLAFGASTSGK